MEEVTVENEEDDEELTPEGADMVSRNHGGENGTERGIENQ